VRSRQCQPNQANLALSRLYAASSWPCFDSLIIPSTAVLGL
jgi:hypothetical protein